MKKYLQPQMEVLNFHAEGTIASSDFGANNNMEGEGAVLSNEMNGYGVESMWNE